MKIMLNEKRSTSF